MLTCELVPVGSGLKVVVPVPRRVPLAPEKMPVPPVSV
jgi:hypothetical protein